MCSKRPVLKIPTGSKSKLSFKSWKFILSAPDSPTIQLDFDGNLTEFDSADRYLFDNISNFIKELTLDNDITVKTVEFVNFFIDPQSFALFKAKHLKIDIRNGFRYWENYFQILLRYHPKFDTLDYRQENSDPTPFHDLIRLRRQIAYNITITTDKLSNAIIPVSRIPANLFRIHEKLASTDRPDIAALCDEYRSGWQNALDGSYIISWNEKVLSESEMLDYCRENCPAGGEVQWYEGRHLICLPINDYCELHLAPTPPTRLNHFNASLRISIHIKDDIFDRLRFSYPDSLHISLIRVIQPKLHIWMSEIKNRYPRRYRRIRAPVATFLDYFEWLVALVTPFSFNLIVSFPFFNLFTTSAWQEFFYP